MFNKTGTFGGAGKSGCEDPVRTRRAPSGSRWNCRKVGVSIARARPSAVASLG